MKNKLLFYLSILLLFSCSNTFENSQVVVESKYFHIPYCHSIEINDSANLPKNTLRTSKAAFESKIGQDLSKKLKFSGSQVISNKSLKFVEERSEVEILLSQNDTMSFSNGQNCGSLYNYPIYKTYYSMKLPEIGLDSIGLEFIIDHNDSIIRNIGFPTYDQTTNSLNIIPIDSVYAEIERRRISKKNLSIDAWYSYQNDVIFWSVQTMIGQGSFIGGGCTPSYEFHFQINSNNGDIIEYSPAIQDSYFLDRFNKRDEYL